MQFDLDKRSASLGIGELASFLLGPRDSSEGPQGIWRAQLGSRWHTELRERAATEFPTARFELPITGCLVHKGWKLQLSGRIDQLLPRSHGPVLREIKTVLRNLPCDEAELRAEYPAYFAQAACYAALFSLLHADQSRASSELLFVEAGTGTAQAVALSPRDEGSLLAQLERVCAFLAERLRSRERLARLRIRPPFEHFRTGQETALASLRSALAEGRSALLFEAPTGFGKTGVLLDAALAALSSGHFERLLYLTGKATGQLQVVRTLSDMTGSGSSCHLSLDTQSSGSSEPPSAWLVRPKSEHCINTVFHCVREVCPHLRDLAARWERSGLARLTTDPRTARDLASLRSAGADAGICPYEITRAALPFADVWIGDFNYVFAPSVRSFFLEQPGFSAGRTLLIIDEAHNLPARVADAYSHRFTLDDALLVLSALHQVRAPSRLLLAWEHWCHVLRQLPRRNALPLSEEDEVLDVLSQISRLLADTPLDYATLGQRAAELLWQGSALVNERTLEPRLVHHWWSPQASSLNATCLDASAAIGSGLREFGGVILASATFGPHDAFAEALGLSAPPLHEPRSLALLADEAPDATPAGDSGRLGKLTKRQTKKLFSKITNAAALLETEALLDRSTLLGIQGSAPWREGAYRVAVDLRVDTRFQQRDQHLGDTAQTLADWHALAARAEPGLAVFFPSYAYAEAILPLLAALPGAPKALLQPRQADLGEQAAWVEKALTEADALFLVLGSSFAESIDLLGGRIHRVLVVGPALPEVNPVQHARMEALKRLGREASFRRVYQVPGMQKVNQALGRLVRAPGHHASVLLHCRRFDEATYQALLLPEYQGGARIRDNSSFAAWARSQP